MEVARRLVKNTGILYAKMAITLFTSLYSTRLILAALGIEDFGLFNVVGGLISMLGFLNASMTAASQRFMSYERGKGDIHRVKKIFNMSTLMHFCIAIVLVLVFEVAGYFFLNGILNITPNRLLAAKTIYQFMIVSTFFTIVSIPYEAVITSHENMSFYAFEGIIEALAKLAIAFYITYNSYDHLISYGFLMAVLSILLLILRRIYCHRKYEECQIKVRTFFDKGLLKEMSSFAGWTFLGSFTSIITNYGQGILLNSFFGVTVNAAQGVSNQISGQLEAFSANMSKAANPMIIKSEGANNRERMLAISITTNKISFILFAIFALPFITEIDYVFSIWLKEIPKYGVIFTVLLLLRRLISQLSNTLFVSIDASGKIKGRQIAGAVLNFFPLIISYILFKLGFSPIYLYIVFIGIELIRSFGHTLYFAKKHCDLDIVKFMRQSVIPCVIVSLAAFLLGLIPFYSMESSLIRLILVGMVISFSFVLLSYLIILNQSEKDIVKRLFINLNYFKINKL